MEEPLLGWRKGGYNHLIVAALMRFNLPFLMLQYYYFGTLVIRCLIGGQLMDV